MYLIFRWSFRTFLVTWLVASVAWTQVQDSPPAQNPPSNHPRQTAPSSATQEPTEPKISAKETEELFRSIDDILRFSSQDSGLPIKAEVKRKLASRDEVVSYLQKHMSEDEDAQRLQRSELVLKKFGLIPRDFDLQKYLVAILREQVAGYYDPKAKVVNLLDWVDTEQQKPVMAHELTHALQDQSFGLEDWMRAGAADLADKRNEVTPEDIENDEVSTARQAVVEGQAMVVLIDYMLEPTGQSLLESPQIAEALKQGMLVGTADSPQFIGAPVYLKEALVFPYRYGLDFEAALLKQGGKEKAFAGVFKNPPRSTREIMEPETYLDGEHLKAMPLPDFNKVFKGHELFDIGAVGEFDVAMLVDQFAGTETSNEMYPHWRGGYYYAVKTKGDPAAPLGLVYASRWADPGTAAQFAAIYAKSLNERYKRARQVEDGKSLPINLKAVQSLTGQHTWLTEEGLVVIIVRDDTVLVSESLDEPTTKKLEEAVFKK
ncbi:MAG TPA: hypothetical protein VH437_05600 [Terriglobales bacterium]